MVALRRSRRPCKAGRAPGRGPGRAGAVPNGMRRGAPATVLAGYGRPTAPAHATHGARSAERGGRARREECRAGDGGGAGPAPNGTRHSRTAPYEVTPAKAGQLHLRMRHTRARSSERGGQARVGRAAGCGCRNADCCWPTAHANATHAGALGRARWPGTAGKAPGRGRRRGLRAGTSAGCEADDCNGKLLIICAHAHAGA